MNNNKIFNDLANFLTNMVARGATDDELERGIMFSADVIKSYTENNMGEIVNKYMGDNNAVTAIGTYKDPNLTWTAEELGIKKMEKETKQNDNT